MAVISLKCDTDFQGCILYFIGFPNFQIILRQTQTIIIPTDKIDPDTACIQYLSILASFYMESEHE